MMQRFACAGRRALTLLWVLAIWAAPFVPADAQQWKFDPRVALSSQYDDNYRLDSPPVKSISVYGSSLDASIQLQRITPTTTVMFVPRIWSSYFPGNTEVDSNDQFGVFDVTHTGKTSAEALKVDYRRQTLLKENLPDSLTGTDLGQPSRGTDVGALFEKARQVLWLIDPQGQVDLTPRQRLEFKGEYLSTTYSQQARTDYVPYTNALGSGGYVFQVSPRSSLTVRASGSKFKPEVGADSTTTGGEIEWDTRWSETARYYFRAGVDHTEYDASTFFHTAARDANSLSAGAGVSWAFPITTIFLDALRNESPSSGGYAVLQDQLRLQLEHRFTPLLASFVNVSAIKNDSLGGESTNQSDRRYAAARTGLEWRIRREWSLIGAYGYTWQNYVNLHDKAHSNDINISIVYEPHRPENGPAVTVGY
jgi:hypothetical protein